MRTWTLREDLYHRFHQWPLLLLFVAAGCLAGWVLSLLWPVAYRATAQIYVGLNPYRALDDSRFLAQARPRYSNIDDYKNWQMSQLQAAVFLDEILEETLRNLRQEDLAWTEVDLGELRAMLQSNWRTAGRWSLTAEGRDPASVVQAAQAWSQAVVRRSNEAIAIAQTTIETDALLQDTVLRLDKASETLVRLGSARQKLDAWLGNARALPPEDPLESAERVEALSVEAELQPDGFAASSVRPGMKAPRLDWILWLEENGVQAEITMAQLKTEIEQLESEQVALSRQYEDQVERSLSLAPSMEIESLDTGVTAVPVRPAGLLILVSGLVGLLAWGITQLAAITSLGKRGDRLGTTTR